MKVAKLLDLIDLSKEERKISGKTNGNLLEFRVSSLTKIARQGAHIDRYRQLAERQQSVLQNIEALMQIRVKRESLGKRLKKSRENDDDRRVVIK